jgi:hypothetical protein
MPGSLNDADNADNAVQDAWLRLSRSAAGEQSARDVRPSSNHSPGPGAKTPSHAP